MQEREKLGTVDVPIQDLVGGVNRSKSSTTIAPTEFVTVDNYIAAPRGLVRGGAARRLAIENDEQRFHYAYETVGGFYHSNFLGPYATDYYAVTSPMKNPTQRCIDLYTSEFGNWNRIVNFELEDSSKHTILLTDKHIFEIDTITGTRKFSLISELLGKIESYPPYTYDSLGEFQVWYDPEVNNDPYYYELKLLYAEANLPWPIETFGPLDLLRNNLVHFSLNLDKYELNYYGDAEDSLIRDFAGTIIRFSDEAVTLTAGAPAAANSVMHVKILKENVNIEAFPIRIREYDTLPVTTGGQLKVYQRHSELYSLLRFQNNIFFSDYSDTPTRLYGLDTDSIYRFLPYSWTPDGATIDPEIQGPRAMAEHRQRIIIGNLYETVGGQRVREPLRIRWSEPINPLKIEADAFYDLNEYGDEITHIVPYMDMLVIFLRNSIYIGQISGGIKLPYIFTKLPTAGIGLDYGRSASVIENNLIFVGQDDVYLFNINEGLQRIGTKIFNHLADNKRNAFNRSVIEYFPEEQTVVILFKSSLQVENESGGQLWAFHLVTRAWTRLQREVSNIAFAGFTTTLRYDNYDTETINSLTGSYDSYSDTISERALLLFNANTTYRYDLRVSDDSTWDFNTTQLLETGDLSFGIPNVEKIVTRLSIALAESYGISGDEPPLTFRVEASVKRGIEGSWKNVGLLRIPTGKNEGKIDCLVSGSTVRFRLSTDQLNSPYTIVEYAMRVRSRGIEVFFK